ncbi:hypothetical protein O181_049688 [Austropuccinia psidii MF-1]|uniref:Integrase catalytic domain-containing protein n=1 Tax=Austropuccinia psidii MF-1 TaxID=1389203 RepID=A0A9Q3DXZ7_9BASI|nr:hypothetical protein [Austropuccinia psidii MF-1]
MDLVRTLTPGGDRSFNAFIVLVDKYRKNSMFFPCYEDEKTIDTVRIIWNKGISHTGLSENIRSDRDPKFTSAVWTNIHNLLGTKLLFSTAYHTQTDGQEESMIQTLEDIIRRFCGYGL